MRQDELKKLDNEIGQYAADQTKIIWVDDQTMQIATMMIDSYGDTVYVWVKEDEDHCRVSDGGRILVQVISLTKTTVKFMLMLTARM